MTTNQLTTTVTPANGEYLNGFECIDCIHQLTQSQGLYSRMSAAIHQMDPEEYDSLVQAFEEAKLKDAVDVILFIEQ
nr:MAG TPA: hypothetical protein [Caudoviricetes sp.]